jgi:predicted lactoylglutathione lyase
MSCSGRAALDKTGVMIPARLTAVTLGARDVPSLRAFYEAMGWNSRPGSDDEFTAFELGGVILALYPLELLQAEAAPDLATANNRAWSGITLALNVETRDQVDEVYATAVAAGARPVTPVQDRDWGGRSGYVSDPEENRWEIAWAPGFLSTEADTIVGT